jgi:hypothetical protein
MEYIEFLIMEEGRKGGRIRERAKSLKEKRRKREERDYLKFKTLFIHL